MKEKTFDILISGIKAAGGLTEAELVSLKELKPWLKEERQKQIFDFVCSIPYFVRPHMWQFGLMSSQERIRCWKRIYPIIKLEAPELLLPKRVKGVPQLPAKKQQKYSMLGGLGGFLGILSDITDVTIASESGSVEIVILK